MTPAPALSTALPVRPTLALLGGLGLVFVPYLTLLPGWLSLVLLSLLGWRALIALGRAPVPPVFTLVLGAALVAWGVAAEYGTLLGRDGGTAFLLLLLALKIHETHTRRDALLLVLLGYFALGANFFFSQGPGTTLYVLFVALLLTLLAAWWRRPDRRFDRARARAVLRLVAGAAPLALALFFVFPRPAEPLWTLPVSGMSGVTGLSNEISPGSISRLTRSSAVAFRADFDGPVPDADTLYWRGPVFDFYDGTSWRPAPLRSGLPLIEGQGEIVRYTLTREPSADPWVLALDLPAEVPSGVRLTSAFQLVDPGAGGARRRYRLASLPSAVAGRGEQSDILQAALQLTGDNPRVRELGASWNALPPAERVERGLALFRSGFRYTLEPPALPAENAIDAFVFGTKQGFCEHYASAFAFLMRAAGLPARVVGGYLGGELNPNGNYLIVRQSFAHAWTEVWLAGEGWRRVDPTAVVSPARLAGDLARSVTDPGALPPLARAGGGLLGQLSLRLDAFQTAWNNAVVGYDGSVQAALASRLGGPGLGFAALLGLLAVVLAAAPLLLALRGRRAPSDPLAETLDLLAARLGLERRSSELPSAFARRAERVHPERGREIHDLVREYEQLRYGPSATREQITAFLRKVRRVRRGR